MKDEFASDALVGRLIAGVFVSDDNGAIKFTAADGGEDVVAVADGDCCSVTWIENIELPAGGFPAKVVTVEDIEFPEDEESEYGYIQFYGLKVVTDMGELIVDYRNESNGYYGGCLLWPGEYGYIAPHAAKWIPARDGGR